MSADHEVLLCDLLSAAGAFTVQALNRLGPGQRMAVGDAMARGAELQLRIVPARRPTDQTRVELVLANANGEAVEVLRILCGGPDLNAAQGKH